MSKPLSAQAVWAIIGSGVVIALVALGLYMYLVLAKVAPLPDRTHVYNLGALSDMQAERSQNVFLKTTALKAVPQSEDEALKYQANELGKSEITQFGQ
jgi:hypothetical protein